MEFDQIEGTSRGKLSVQASSENRGKRDIAKDAVYNRLMKLHNNNSQKVQALLGNVVGQMDILKFEALMVPGQNSYKFNLSEDSNRNNATSLRRGLQTNDLALATDIRVGVRKHLALTTAGPWNGGNSEVFTYIEDAEFSDASENFALRSIYNGILTLKTGTRTRLEMPTSDFRYVPTTQVITATTTPAGVTNAQFGGANAASRGFFDLGDQLYLGGKDTHEISLDLVSPVTTTNIDGSASADVTRGGTAYKHRNYLVIELAVYRFIGLDQPKGQFI